MATLAVGIDVGTSSVKAVALKRTGSGYALRSVGQADIRRAEYHPEESPQSLAEAPLRALERISQDSAFSRKPCAFSVSGPRVAPRLFKFPSIPKGEVEQAIRFEAEQIIPFDLAQAALDYVLFDEGMEEGKPVMEGLVVAVHKEEVDKQYVLLKSGGFDPVVLDIDTLALSNAYLETEGVADRETVALINIGARFTNLAILHGPRRVFVRDIASGGDMLSRAISEIYGLDLPQAEKRKREATYTPLDELEGGADAGGGDLGETQPAGGTEGFGDTEGFQPVDEGNEEYVLLDSDETGFTSGGGDTMTGDEEQGFAASGETQNNMTAAQRISANRAVLVDALGDLISEIQDTFKYYINRRIVPRIDKVRLCGGTAKFPDIDEFFASQLGVPAQLWNPFARLDVGGVAGKFPPNFLDELGPLMAIATGLAMRQL
ncbi:MAG: type IV pilus assembly protein PilM [Planctomycetes bacterium]|jgi:type IV pilus assembly protein PilM|nr:type IV pilus assembly protein PilM [Planctomycetota bacterium]MCL4730284.1 type IV pilus assembly protein PilM [Planctomycetota bacterium]